MSAMKDFSSGALRSSWSSLMVPVGSTWMDNPLPRERPNVKPGIPAERNGDCAAVFASECFGMF